MARKTLSPGTKLGRYVIQAEQYQDDAGVTYVGEDHGAPFRPHVYIREFFPASISRRRRHDVHPARRALKDEYAEALSQQIDRIDRYMNVHGSGLVRALDKVEAHGTVYLVTDWPNGDSLQVMQERDGKFSPGFVRSLLAELEPGLQKLGDAGVVHGQIAPDMIRRLDNGDLAVTHPDRLEYCSGEGPATLADPINTPYLAPEFVSTEAGRIGPWCDVYSVAASFYQLITGLVPASAQLRLEAAESGEDDPLDMLALDTQLDDDPALFSALQSALSLKAADRPAGLAALIAAAEFTAATPVPEVMEATGLSTVEPAGFWATNGRLIAALAAIFLIVAVAIPVFMMNGGDTTNPQVLAQNETPVDQQATRSDTVSEPVPGSDDDVGVEANETEAGIEDQPQNGDADDATELAVITADETVPEDVSAWLAVDQDDAGAVLTFFETVSDNPVLRSQVRARWLTLESEAWVEARAADTEESYQALLAMYGETPPPFARHYDDANERLARLTEDEDSEPSESDIPTDMATLSEDLAVTETDDAEGDTDADESAADDEASAQERVVSVLTPVAAEDVESPVEAAATADEQASVEPAEADEVESAAPEPETEPVGPDQDCPTCPVMVSASGLPEVSVSAREISVAEFRAYLSATGRAAPTGCFTHRLNSQSLWGYSSDANYASPGYAVSDASPASCISYDEAVQYTDWLSRQSGETYRLLSAEEWTSMAGPVSPGLMACSANFADQSLADSGLQTPLLTCSDGDAFAVAGGTASLSVTYGNLAEWVSDCQNGDCNRRTAMGGSWVTGPAQIRGNMQEVFSPNSRSNTLGFRVLRE